MVQPPKEEPRENLVTTPDESAKSKQPIAQELLDFKFVEVRAIPRLNRNGLSCS
jgi:hypothetical protein